MKHKLILFLLLTPPLVTFSQEGFTGFKGEHFIEVTGTSRLEIEPNEIYTIIRLREFEENRQKTSLEKLDTDFLNALKQAGIDRKRLELSDIGSQLGKLGRKDKDAFRDKTYQLKLTSAAELEKLLEKLETVMVDFFDITRVHHSDYEKIKTDLKTTALQAARAKAEVLLKSIGAAIGKPLMIRDWEVEPYMPMMGMEENVRTENMGSLDQAAQEVVPIGFRKMKLQAQITAQFQIL